MMEAMAFSMRSKATCCGEDATAVWDVGMVRSQELAQDPTTSTLSAAASWFVEACT